MVLGRSRRFGDGLGEGEGVSACGGEEGRLPLQFVRGAWMRFVPKLSAQSSETQAMSTALNELHSEMSRMQDRLKVARPLPSN